MGIQPIAKRVFVSLHDLGRVEVWDALEGVQRHKHCAARSVDDLTLEGSLVLLSITA